MMTSEEVNEVLAVVPPVPATYRGPEGHHRVVRISDLGGAVYWANLAAGYKHSGESLHAYLKCQGEVPWNFMVYYLLGHYLLDSIADPGYAVKVLKQLLQWYGPPSTVGLGWDDDWGGPDKLPLSWKDWNGDGGVYARDVSRYPILTLPKVTGTRLFAERRLFCLSEEFSPSRFRGDSAWCDICIFDSSLSRLQVENCRQLTLNRNGRFGWVETQGVCCVNVLDSGEHSSAVGCIIGSLTYFSNAPLARVVDADDYYISSRYYSNNNGLITVQDKNALIGSIAIYSCKDPLRRGGSTEENRDGEAIVRIQIPAKTEYNKGLEIKLDCNDTVLWLLECGPGTTVRGPRSKIRVTFTNICLRTLVLLTSEYRTSFGPSDNFYICSGVVEDWELFQRQQQQQARSLASSARSPQWSEINEGLRRLIERAYECLEIPFYQGVRVDRPIVGVVRGGEGASRSTINNEFLLYRAQLWSSDIVVTSLFRDSLDGAGVVGTAVETEPVVVEPWQVPSGADPELDDLG